MNKSVLFPFVEFYNLPNGDVMYIHQGESKKMEECDRELIAFISDQIQSKYPKAYNRLAEIYSDRKMNHDFFRYSIVKRFIRCNLGEMDYYSTDLDDRGQFCFEEVRCPLRGECKQEGVICKPVLDSALSEREMEIFRLIVSGYEASDIADTICRSIHTVNNHRDNIKKKIGVKSVAQMVAYWNDNRMK